MFYLAELVRAPGNCLSTSISVLLQRNSVRFHPISSYSLNVHFPLIARRYDDAVFYSFFHFAALKWPIYLFSIEKFPTRCASLRWIYTTDTLLYTHLWRKAPFITADRRQKNEEMGPKQQKWLRNDAFLWELLLFCFAQREIIKNQIGTIFLTDQCTWGLLITWSDGLN